MNSYIRSLEDVLRPEIKKKGFHVLNVSKKLNMHSFIEAKKNMEARFKVN